MRAAKTFYAFCVFLVTLSVFSALNAQQNASEETVTETEDIETGPAEKKVPENEESASLSWEYDIDPYYSNIGLVIPLTSEPVPDVGKKNEFQIYRDLFLDSYIPRFFYVEASVNPMPIAGLAFREYAPETYEKADLSRSLNLVRAVTAGFEEPYAASFFLGNLVRFSPPSENVDIGANTGFMGYLLSTGNYHIVQNVAVKDWWYEIEWKIKGDREFDYQRLNWSFRLGAKLHEHHEIADALYLSLRRSRLDFLQKQFSFFHNTGYEYTVDFNFDNFAAIKHYLLLEKKWPFNKTRLAFTLAIGLLWESSSKYKGSLKEYWYEDDNFEIILRPNIEF